MVDYTRLVVVPRGEGVTEWRVEVPLISPADVAFLLALGGLVSWVRLVLWQPYLRLLCFCAC